MNELALVQNLNGGGLQKVDPAAVAAATSAKARIESAFMIAMHKPRNADQSRDCILHACKRPAFADKVEFSKPVGGKKIVGPSIRFAELALREWGNVMSDIQVLYEDDFIRRSKVMIIDLETNCSFSKEIQIGKTVERKSKADREVLGERTNTGGDKVFIVKATEDELQNKENAAISKAVRNEGLRVIPSDIVDEALATARATLLDRDKKDPDAAKKVLLDAFSEIGIKPMDLQAYLKHPTDHLSPAELQDLRSVYRAIRDGEAKWADYLQASEAEAATVSKTDTLKGKLKAAGLGGRVSGKAADKGAPAAGAPAASAVATPAADPGDVQDPSTEEAPGECPDRPGQTMMKAFCDKCKSRQGCPVWEK